MSSLTSLVHETAAEPRARKTPRTNIPMRTVIVAAIVVVRLAVNDRNASPKKSLKRLTAGYEP
jgi:hypothetical protein